MAAVQTREGKLRIARDLIERAARAAEDEDYQELIKKWNPEQTLKNCPKKIHTNVMERNGTI